MSRRTQIVDSTELVLQSILDGDGEVLFKYTEKNKISPIDLKNIPFPAAFIYIGDQIRVTDSSDEAVIGSNTVTWRANLIIEFWVNGDNDVEDALARVQSAMETNYRLDALCSYSRLVSFEHYIIDIDKEIQAMSMNFEVLFRHNRFNP